MRAALFTGRPCLDIEVDEEICSGHLDPLVATHYAKKVMPLSIFGASQDVEEDDFNLDFPLSWYTSKTLSLFACRTFCWVLVIF